MWLCQQSLLYTTIMLVDSYSQVACLGHGIWSDLHESDIIQCTFASGIILFFKLLFQDISPRLIPAGYMRWSYFTPAWWSSIKLSQTQSCLYEHKEWGLVSSPPCKPLMIWFLSRPVIRSGDAFTSLESTEQAKPLQMSLLTSFEATSRRSTTAFSARKNDVTRLVLLVMARFSSVLNAYCCTPGNSHQ